MIKKLAFISLLLFAAGCSLVEDETTQPPSMPSPFADSAAPAPIQETPAPFAPTSADAAPATPVASTPATIAMNPASPSLGVTPGTITPPAEDKPLMVIRFNQDFVHYDSPLYMAVKKALDTKPNAIFNAVVYYPAGADEDAATANRQAAENEGSKLMNSFAKAGVLTGQTKISYQPTPQLSNNEIKIFVE